MKILFIVISSIICVSGFSQNSDTIKVSTIDELFEAISSNKVVLLEEGNYDISKLDADKKTNSAKMEIVKHWAKGTTTPGELVEITGNLLTINGVSNVKIIGVGTKKSKIYTSSVASVLSFKNCKDVALDNIASKPIYKI